jgi:hypothetical protein
MHALAVTPRVVLACQGHPWSVRRQLAFRTSGSGRLHAENQTPGNAAFMSRSLVHSAGRDGRRLARDAASPQVRRGAKADPRNDGSGRHY